MKSICIIPKDFPFFFSLPESQAPGELIVKAGSVVRRTSSVDYPQFQTTSPPKQRKFHIQPLGPLCTKSCSNVLRQMINMAATPIS